MTGATTPAGMAPADAPADTPNAPIIVTALLGDADFAWADALRRAHFPPARNRVPAHVTLFHHLPPSLAAEIAERLAGEARARAPEAVIARVLRLGAGTAFAIHSAELSAIRARLADAWAGLLTPQDAAGWRAHLTVQNKVPRAAAEALHATLADGFRPRPLAIAGLAAWRYLGGPWERLSTHMFLG